MKEVYVIMGEVEEIAQERVGGDFISTYIANPVGYVNSKEEADAYIHNLKLKTPKKESFSGTKYYRGGYYDMWWDKIEKL